MIFRPSRTLAGLTLAARLFAGTAHAQAATGITR
jgi:hypothetical protein